MTDEEQDKAIAELYRWAQATHVSVRTTAETVKTMMVLTEEILSDTKEMAKELEKAIRLLEESNDPE